MPGFCISAIKDRRPALKKTPGVLSLRDPELSQDSG
jgi:hypothetical protein